MLLTYIYYSTTLHASYLHNISINHDLVMLLNCLQYSFYVYLTCITIDVKKTIEYCCAVLDFHQSVRFWIKTAVSVSISKPSQHYNRTPVLFCLLRANIPVSLKCELDRRRSNCMQICSVIFRTV